MNVPVYLLCYDSAKLLDLALGEARRTNTPSLEVWDDGSEDPKMVDLLSKTRNVYRKPHMGYREQFIAIGEHARMLGYKFYCYIEDDASFSVNWYAYAMKKLDGMLAAGLPVGVFALYTGHPAIEKKILPHVFEHRGEHFYGTCALVINTEFVDEMAQAIRGGLNPDIAIREALGMVRHPRWNLYVVIPTLAQHRGKDTRLNAPFHWSASHLGDEVDALAVLM